MSSTIDLATQLISRCSLTPDDAGCQEILLARLKALGFKTECLRFGMVDNLWARKGTGKPLVVFAGHTDVVPTGPLEQWQFPPFEPVISDGMLYGRGAADMKGSLAAMITGVEGFLTNYPEHQGSIAFLITSDEEGPGVDGTARVVELLKSRGEQIDYCVVGEPSSVKQLGDTIKNGRRGSLNGKVTIHGKQGHIAYPKRALNPIHKFAVALNELCAMEWDGGNTSFPATTFQFSNLHSGTHADNVIPAQLEASFNFRFSTEVTAEQLQAKVVEILDRHGLKYDLLWRLSGNPFLTKKGMLVQAVSAAIQDVSGISPELSTSGGTSDGRFIAPTGAEVVEVGPINSTSHQVNECVRVDELEKLSLIYQKLLAYLLETKPGTISD